MRKTLISKDRITMGYQRFLAEHPRAKAEVDAIPMEIAEAIGVELSELHLQKTVELIAQRAGELNLEYFEYLLQLSVEDEDERQKIRQFREDEISRCLV